MAKSSSSSAREARDLTALLRAAKGDALPYRQFFEQLAHVVAMSQGLIVTTLPRGSLQIAQPPRLSEELLRPYAKRFHAEDRPTWQAIIRRKAVRARDCWSATEFENSIYCREFLRANGFEHAAIAPLSAPVLEGYPGALHLYRSEDLGPFADPEMARIEAVARELDETIARTRAGRRAGATRGAAAELPLRQFIFDQQLNLILPRGEERSVDDRLRQNMLEYARFRLGHVNGKAIESDRVSLPDSRGTLLHFRVVIHRAYPAIGEGPFVFFCLQPPTGDWSALRPVDFQADSDVARLVPALRFMRDHYQRGPTLTEIARNVNLSPFHFHRRFTELFGITPKHFMLDCQIEQAKSDLLSRAKELAKIASSCGFAHQSHFTSRFKQATGLTPTRWRRMVGQSKKPSRA